MFSPIFKITNKTLFNLIEVEVAGGNKAKTRKCGQKDF
ncbi:MAG: hypothetical protein UW58_C0055G0008 [Candidatus Collierbacteria bacterium GW2011_GWC2_44_30]|nr:MAG: hypothetical protein UW58_C0055G0008 [Candidatus Collierbacteria bacterium GW2011_GWC2_44_30]